MLNIVLRWSGTESPHSIQGYDSAFNHPLPGGEFSDFQKMLPRWSLRPEHERESARSLRRHSDCPYLEEREPYLNKWLAAPGLRGKQVEWKLHSIDGLTGACELAAQ